MKHPGLHCHSQAAVAAQIAAVRDEWRRALASATAVVRHARARSPLVMAAGRPVVPPSALELPCR